MWETAEKAEVITANLMWSVYVISQAVIKGSPSMFWSGLAHRKRCREFHQRILYLGRSDGPHFNLLELHLIIIHTGQGSVGREA
jgi:hypothetical protein